jgi:hypothetical protein
MGGLSTDVGQHSTSNIQGRPILIWALYLGLLRLAVQTLVELTAF